MEHKGPTFPAAFDIVTPFHSKDADVFWSYTIPSLLKNAVGLQKIYVVCAAEAWRDLASSQIEFIDETKYKFSFQDIKAYLDNTSRAGWY